MAYYNSFFSSTLIFVTIDSPEGPGVLMMTN